METPEMTSDAPAPSRYWTLDQLLLKVLAVELGYFSLLILLGAIGAITAFFSDKWGIDNLLANTIIIYLPLPILYLGNLVGGLFGIILNIQDRVEGYPGTGHILNWMFIMTTSWLFLVFLFFVLPNSSGGFID